MHALLFDLDGTLTDPAQGITRCFAHAFERLQIETPADLDFRQFIGPPMHQVLEPLIPRERIPQAVGFYRERFRTVGIYENALYPGITELLERARKSYAMYVCTSKPTVFATEILRYFAIDGYFDAVYGSELDGRFAHKPELFAHLLEREGLCADAVTMIGDRKHDVIAALENGAKAYGAAWGYGSIEELREAGAHAIYESPAALKAVLA